MDNIRSLIRGVLRTSQFWLGFFVVSLVAVHSIATAVFAAYAPHEAELYRNVGGPDLIAQVGLPAQAGTNADFSPGTSPYSFPVIVASPGISERQGNAVVFIESAAAVGTTHPFSNVIPTRYGLLKYKVREGDTLSSIAAEFLVSLETIKWANLNIGSVITPGQELIILPVSGILYEVQEEDSLEGIASRYRIDPELIKKYNEEYQKLLESPKEMIVLPYAKPINRWAYINQYRKNLPNMDEFFSLPARGWNWGELHYYNAVDIAAACGNSIYASAEGLVMRESDENRWNDGYGNYILIEHPNGTKTRYSHTLKNFVGVGDYVLQSDEIAFIGNSGNTHGPTGCHLHFEVQGAQNPFAVR